MRRCGLYVLVACGLLATALPLAAQNSLTGTLDSGTSGLPTNLTGPDWTVGALYLGDSTNNTMTIGAGGTLAYWDAWLAYTTGRTAVLDVNGGEVNASYSTSVGYAANSTGTLRVRNGGNFSVGGLAAGFGSGSNALIDVDGGTVETSLLYLNDNGHDWAASTVVTVHGAGGFHAMGTSQFPDDAIRFGTSQINVFDTGSMRLDDLVQIQGDVVINVGGSGSITAENFDVHAFQSLHINVSDAGSFTAGNLLLSGGDLGLDGNITMNTLTLGPGDNVATVTGGTVTASGVVVTTNLGTGTLNLDGGVLATTNVTEGYPPIYPGGAGAVRFDGGTLRLTAATPVLFNWFENGDITLGAGGGTIDTQAFNVTTSVGLGGTGQLTKAGSGTLTLFSTNTYTGGTDVTGGLLLIPGTINHPYANFSTHGGNFRINNTGAVTASNVSIANGSGEVTNNGSLTVSGTMLIGVGGVADLTLTGGNVTANTVALGAPLLFGFTYASTLNLNGGTLTTSQISEGLAVGAVTFAGGTLRLSADQPALFSGFESNDIKLGAGGGVIDTQEFAVVNAVRLSGPGALTKQGAGSLTLTGTNTYTGGTAVNAGSLIVNGSIAANSLTTVAADATLGGTGTVGALVLSGTLSPGNSPGTLSAGDTTWNPGGSYQWEINDATGVAGTNWDLLAINGTLALGGLDAGDPFTINLITLNGAGEAGEAINFSLTQGYSWTLVATTGGILGFDPADFALNVAGFANAVDADLFSLASDGYNLTLTYAAVPEPATYAAIAGAFVLGVAFFWRRRNRKAVSG